MALPTPWFQTPGLWSYRRIHFCSFNALNVWFFYAALGHCCSHCDGCAGRAPWGSVCISWWTRTVDSSPRAQLITVLCSEVSVPDFCSFLIGLFCWLVCFIAVEF